MVANKRPKRTIFHSPTARLLSLGVVFFLCSNILIADLGLLYLDNGIFSLSSGTISAADFSNTPTCEHALDLLNNTNPWKAQQLRKLSARVINSTVDFDNSTDASAVRVLCFLDSDDQARTRAVSVTWGRDCDKLIVFQREHVMEFSPNAKTFVLKQGVVATTDSWERLKLILRFVHFSYGTEYDWFLRANDHNYVMLPKLRAFLVSPRVRELQLAGEPVHLGKTSLVRTKTTMGGHKHMAYTIGSASHAMDRSFLSKTTASFQSHTFAGCTNSLVLNVADPTAMISTCGSYFGLFPVLAATHNGAIFLDTAIEELRVDSVAKEFVAIPFLSAAEVTYFHVAIGAQCPQHNDNTVGDKTTLWKHKAAVRRANSLAIASSISQKSLPPKRVAVMLQLGTNLDLLHDLITCAANVATASHQSLLYSDQSLDVYVAFVSEKKKKEGSDSADSTKRTILTELRSAIPSALLPDGNIFIQTTENRGGDMGEFLLQMAEMKSRGRAYDVILKTHAKTDPIWRERMLESLCGTPEQVHSVFSIFNESRPSLLAPLGTAFGPRTSIRDIFPHIVKKYALKTAEVVFGDAHVSKMNELRLLLDPNASEFHPDELRICAGSSFWIADRALQSHRWVSVASRIIPLLTKGYAVDQGMEHAMERVIPSLIASESGNILEIQPAPRTFAMYFPQYHRFRENDKFWGEGFTEWTLLKPLIVDHGPPLRKPLSVEEGGLGYYDLMDKETRRRQADIARQFGRQGFVYYHYWFSGRNAPPEHKVMAETLEAMLLDEEPDLPFMLSWANEPWTRRWGGNSNEEVLLSQEYGDVGDWDEHFDYLAKFLSHPNYVRVGGKPVIIIYRIGHGDGMYENILNRWRDLAGAYGFPGLHVVQTVGNFYRSDWSTAAVARETKLEASFHFWPQIFASFPSIDQNSTSSIADVNLDLGDGHLQYWGAFTGFDRRPRDPNTTSLFTRSPKEFKEGLLASFNVLSRYASRPVDTNFFFVTAWNEWNEQALLEPDALHNTAYLEGMLHSLQNVPARQILPWKPILPREQQGKSHSKSSTLLVIATRPRSARYLLALWTLLECFTEGVDKLLIASDQKYASRLEPLAIEAREKLMLDIEVRYYVNDRYDAGLWCDALSDVGLFESLLEGARYKRVLLLNDSVFALRKFNGVLGALKASNATLVSLSESHNGDLGKWVESVFRGIRTTPSLRNFEAQTCVSAASLAGCNAYEEDMKKCIIRKYEMELILPFADDEVLGLFNSNPIEYPEKFSNWITDELSWRLLVQNESFPVAKVKNEYFTFIENNLRFSKLNSSILQQCTTELNQRFLLDQLGLKRVFVTSMGRLGSIYGHEIDDSGTKRYIVRIDDQNNGSNNFGFSVYDLDPVFPLPSEGYEW